MPTDVEQKQDKKRRGLFLAGGVAAVCLVAALLLLLVSPSPATSEGGSLPSPEADQEPPVISGAWDLVAVQGETVSYRDGVTVTDNVDPSVRLQVDAGQVDLSQPGEYPVTYSATDAQGNTASVTVTLTVLPAETEPEVDPGSEEALDPVEPETAASAAPQRAEGTVKVQQPPKEITQEDLDALADGILGKLVKEGMSSRQIARAIYDYVHTHIRYTGSSDKSSWINGAYIGFTRGRGDCFNYYACSKELLTRAGIPNIDLRRVGGTTQHFWQLINVGDGWYHFDTCYHPVGHNRETFMLTEAEARAFTAECQDIRPNYYVYDYASCPVTVVGTPAEELPAQEPSAEELPGEDLPGEELPAEDPALNGELPPEGEDILLPPGVIAEPSAEPLDPGLDQENPPEPPVPPEISEPPALPSEELPPPEPVPEPLPPETAGES